MFITAGFIWYVIFWLSKHVSDRKQLEESSLYIYDHLGNSGLDNLCARIEFMAVSLGVDVIVLDHITAAAAGLLTTDNDYDGGSSERLLIDNSTCYLTVNI